MWWSLRPASQNRFSLERFKVLNDELQNVKLVDRLNKDFVGDLLRSVVEIVIYGDQHDPLIFEYFMERQGLAQFLRILKISEALSIEVQLLQSLSIMIQNLNSENAIYYCFSNGYIDNIIIHPFKFDDGELAPYYVSFLRTVSGKLDGHTICLLLKVQDEVAVSFPLYTEAIKFAYHEEKMIQIAVRALTLSIYNINDEILHTFITTPPRSEYFSDFVQYLRSRCYKLDILINATKNDHTHMKELLQETDKIMDDLYYCNDILGVGVTHLSKLITKSVLTSLILPVLLPSLHLGQNSELCVSPITSLYVLCRLLQIVGGKELVNCVAAGLLYNYTSKNVSSDLDTNRWHFHAELLCECSLEIKEYIISMRNLEFKRERDGNMKRPEGDLLKHALHGSHNGSSEWNSIQNPRSWLSSLIFSGNFCLMLPAIMFLLILSEKGDIDLNDLLLSVMGITEEEFQETFTMVMNSIIIYLSSQQPMSTDSLWNAGWILQKLLACQEKIPIDSFAISVKILYESSSKKLMKELNGCWLDLIPITLKMEWDNCMKVLKESCRQKDPLVFLETPLHDHIPDGDISSFLAWERMLDIVKVFVLHYQLHVYASKHDLQENPLSHFRSSSLGSSGTPGMDNLPVKFGMELDLGSGIPCKIAFEEHQEKDMFVVPVTKGISGKVLLAEEIFPDSNQGVVFAMAPLAGLNPKIDETHQRWLHLRIRTKAPTVGVNETSTSGLQSKHPDDGRWTIGFSDIETCKSARTLILEKRAEQRSAVLSILAPLLGSSNIDVED
ncbi:uncharacterized protein LOC18444455 isoform X1 [Amborella trichopoda]|uniref:uncharacterized protein LOC18444455 isoform X1 n=1 Tax=Amborella trichopoda TaxID=13333 RepID=UPI0005D3FB3D|nr:uncharacterized protein LOC18444455 isoform X1 [Amborella trichopoda]|eukprot:XP_011627149.1 uncharacterized protein LOC18444455 isoform X1 [Amborella trichopoda]